MLPLGPGKILYINLSNLETRIETIDQDIIKKYLGGRGLGAYLLYKLVSPQQDPYDPASPLLFLPGMLTGTGVPSSGRTTVTFKSPATGYYCKSSGGGSFGAELKYAGFDALVITGRALSPTYLTIDDDQVKFGDASFLWGLDVRETDRLLKKKLGDEEWKIGSIGPAGENMVKFASVQFNINNSAARGGGGAVMGNKKLKAIALRGSQKIRVFDVEGLKTQLTSTREKYKTNTLVPVLAKYGTSAGIEGSSLRGTFPCRNFQEGCIEGAYKISGENLLESGFLKRREGCFSCPTACHRYVEVDEGKYKGTFTGGPEYEAMSALGSGCGSTDVAAVIKANELCNILGMDVISAGGVIQWAMECYQRGVLSQKQADGLDLSWGNMDTENALLQKIAVRDGIGDLLAEGTKIAAERLGHDSIKWAVQAKGLEQSRVDTRGAYGYALAFAVNSRGPDHLMTECLAEFGGNPESAALVKRIAGDEKYCTPISTDKRAEIVRWHEDIYAVSDCLGVCAFTTTAQWWMDEEDLANYFTVCTGISLTATEIMKIGQRIVTLEREFNIREGYTGKDDILPERMMKEVLRTARHKNAINDPERLHGMLREYYQLHGWDVKTGLPTKENIKDLQLDDLIQ